MVSTSGRDEAAQAPDAWKLSEKPMDHYEVAGTGANKTLTCKWCHKGFKGSGSRAYSHLVDGKDVAKCVKVDKGAIQRLKAAKAAANAAANRSKRKADEELQQLQERRSSHGAAGPGPSSASAGAGPSRTSAYSKTRGVRENHRWVCCSCIRPACALTHMHL
jgi:hypothetical protein